MIRIRRNVYGRTVQWIGMRGNRAIVGNPIRAIWFALTGYGFYTRPPFWRFCVDGDRGGGPYGSCSAGLFSRVLYIELVQGCDICTGMFYRWLRIGIPKVGCWRIRLQKRWPS